MNYKAIAHYLEMVFKLLAAMLLIPLAISLYHREPHAVRGLLVTAGLSLLLAAVFGLFRSGGERRDRAIYTKDGFVLVAICWLSISLFGALPFYLSGAIPSFVDALFESVSGFTTTGSTILADIEAMPLGLLFWRSMTHWIGGMGVLVFLLAASGGEHSVHLMKAESTGPQPGKLVPRLRQSSMILYGIYIALTLVQVVMLCLGGMPLYDSLCCAMATAGTGGFFTKNASLAYYDSAYLDAVTTFFMVLFGINFNMIYFLLIRNFRTVWKSEEFRAYIGIFAGSSVAIALNLLAYGHYRNIGTALRYSAFQVGSMMTTTGFATANFDLWPEFSRVLLMLIMMIGASAGSTGGGLKVARLVIVLKEARRSLIRQASPRTVGIVKLDGKAVDKQVVHAVINFFSTYCLLTIVSILLVSLDNFNFETTVTAVLASVGNAGPGLDMVSPIGNYSQFSVFSKLVLSVGMLMGRLEIYPILLLFAPRTWRR